jgi:uncharacterized protein HemX
MAIVRLVLWIAMMSPTAVMSSQSTVYRSQLLTVDGMRKECYGAHNEDIGASVRRTESLKSAVVKQLSREHLL